MTHESIINLDQLEYSESGHGDYYQAQMAPVANLIGAEKLGYRIVKLPAGKRAWPYHAHYANEEMFFVLEGNGSVRIGEENVEIRKGDFISLPPNPNRAHQIINTSGEEMTYLCVSTMIQPEVGIYPDSNKVGVIGGGPPGRTDGDSLKKFFPADVDVDYWEKE